MKELDLSYPLACLWPIQNHVEFLSILEDSMGEKSQFIMYFFLYGWEELESAVGLLRVGPKAGANWVGTLHCQI